MEKKPNKKEELNIVNNVLKLATKLMKVSSWLNMQYLYCISYSYCNTVNSLVIVVVVFALHLICTSQQFHISACVMT